MTLQLALQKHENLATVPLVMDLIEPNEKAALKLGRGEVAIFGLRLCDYSAAS